MICGFTYGDKRMTCSNCAPIEETRTIFSTGRLAAAITMAKEAIRDGILQEVPGGPMSSVIPCSDLNPDGPWDDLLRYRFRCTTCAQVFLLSAETYHGSGGEWAKEAG